MVNHRKSKKTLRRKQKGGFISSIFRGIVNATGGVKMKDGTKRKINPKFSPYRPNEPWLLPARKKQKGGWGQRYFNNRRRRAKRMWGHLE